MELQSVDREYRMLRRQCVRESKRMHEKISPWCAEVALVISCMMQYDFRIGVLWLKYPKRRGAPVPEEFEDSSILHDELENKFLAADINRLTSYLDPATCQLSESVVKTASRFVLDFRLAEMVWRRNMEHGAAAASSDMVSYWNEIKTVQISGIAAAALQDYNNATKCKLYRFRCRMDCRHGVVMYSNKDQTLQEIREKVPVFLIQKMNFFGTKNSKNAPEEGTQN